MRHTLPNLWVELHLLDTPDDRWQLDALCAQTDPERFFPHKGGNNADIRRICAQCPVRQPCLETALENFEMFGIWGGTSREERKAIWRERGIEIPSEDEESDAA